MIKDFLLKNDENKTFIDSEDDRGRSIRKL